MNESPTKPEDGFAYRSGSGLFRGLGSFAFTLFFLAILSPCAVLPLNCAWWMLSDSIKSDVLQVESSNPTP